MPRIVEIYTDNDKLQLLRAVKTNRNKRHRQGYFFVEGVKAINLALEVGWPLVAAIQDRERSLSGWARDVLARVPCIYRVSSGHMAELSDKEETSELILLCAIQSRGLEDIRIEQNLLVLLDRPGSPGNLGTIIRTADAFRADGLLVSGHSADIYDPQTLRASVGTLFSLPTAQVDRPGQVETLRARVPGIRFIGTSAKGERPLHDYDLTGPVLLMMGNETDGLSRAYKESCDALVNIPIYGAASSLNLAAATSIFLYEVQRQRSS